MAGKKGDLQHDNTRNEPLTDDELHALTLQHKKKYESALAKKKAADADLKSVCKVLKADLGDFGLKDIKDMIAAEEDGFDEKFQAELERKARLARWLGIDLGTQADLFDFGAVKPGLAERAYEDGKRAGMAGEVCAPPFDGGGEAHQKFVEGWHAGQAVLAGQIKKTDAKEVPLIVNEDREVSGVDEFDEAATVDDDEESDEIENADTDDEAEWPDDVQVAAREPAETL